MIQLLHWQKPNEVYVKGFLNSIRSLFLLFIYIWFVKIALQVICEMLTLSKFWH